MTELETFQCRFPWKNSESVANEDKNALEKWSEGSITTKGLLVDLARRNEWSTLPGTAEFTAYIQLLGYYRRK